MKSVVALAAAVVALAAAGISNAATMEPCLGADQAYHAAFDARDGTVDGTASYPEKRVFRQVQGWLTRIGETPGHASEHIATGYCFPQGEPWAPGSDRMDAQHHFF